MVAAGTAPLSYQWYIGASGNTTSPIPGATASTYTTPPLTSTTSYWVRVSNAVGSVDSATATITVATTPVFIIQPSNLFIAVGSSGSVSVLAASTPPPTYRWQVSSNGGSTWTNLSDGGPYSGTGTPTLTISGATPALNGLQFRCVASNGTVSTNSAAATLTIVQAIRGLVDLNSDGSGDVFLYNQATGARRFEVTSAGGFVESSSAWDPGWQVYPANLNADGYTDFFLYDPARGFWIQALNHGGDGTFTYTLGNWDSSWTVVPSDLDGDGLTDMFVYNFANGVWVKCFVDGSGGFKGYAVGNWDPGWTFSTADLNGDGRDDFFLYNRTNGIWVEAFSQAGFGTFDYPASGQWDPGWQVIRGDLNRRWAHGSVPAECGGGARQRAEPRRRRLRLRRRAAVVAGLVGRSRRSERRCGDRSVPLQRDDRRLGRGAQRWRGWLHPRGVGNLGSGLDGGDHGLQRGRPRRRASLARGWHVGQGHPHRNRELHLRGGELGHRLDRVRAQALRSEMKRCVVARQKSVV